MKLRYKALQHLARGKTRGAAFFCALEDVNPLLAKEIKGTEIDPSDDDAKLQDFLSAIALAYQE